MKLWSPIDKVLTDMKDYHVPIGLFVYLTGLAMHWYKGLSPVFVTFTTTVFGFLAGHAIFAPGTTSDTQGPTTPVGPTPPTGQ